MKIHHKFLIAVILAASAIVPVATAQAGRIVVEIGDRPYYTRGPFYWDGGVKWLWVPGHWSRNHRTWIRGHYVRSGRGGLPTRLHRRHQRVHRAIFGR